MKRTSAELKRLARETLTGHYGVPMGALVVSQVISVVLDMPFSWNLTANSSLRDWIIYYIAVLVISLVTVVLNVGMMHISLNMVRKQEYQFKDLFFAFRNHPDRYILTAILMVLMVLIPTIPMIGMTMLLFIAGPSTWIIILFIVSVLLLIVGSIYIDMRFGLVYYLLLNHPEVGVREALAESTRLMRGNKGRRLYLSLSFIGWSILGIVSFGVGYLWIGPYITQTETCFYLDVTGELDKQEGFYAEA